MKRLLFALTLAVLVVAIAESRRGHHRCKRPPPCRCNGTEVVPPTEQPEPTTVAVTDEPTSPLPTAAQADTDDSSSSEESSEENNHRRRQRHKCPPPPPCECPETTIAP